MTTVFLPPSYAYLAFAVLAFLLHCGLYWRLPTCRELMNWMSAWGAFLGVLVAQWYRMDFWNPPSIYSFHLGRIYFTVEDFVFGASFSGIVAVLIPSLLAGGRLATVPIDQRVSIRSKIFVPVAVILVSAMSHQFFRWNSIASTAAGFAVGALIMCYLRPDLFLSALGGGFLTTLTLIVLVDVFIIGAANMSELLHLMCQYCRSVRVVYTLDILLVWAFSFGMLFTPLYLFREDVRVVAREP